MAKKALYFEVAKKIENAILRGEWVSGQKLPSILELATRFSVSKAVMREACSLMVGTGILELRHGDGTYVKTLTLDAIMPPIQAALLLGGSELYSLLEVGLWLERGVVGVASVRRSDKQVRELAEFLFLMETGSESFTSLIMAERQFHGVLAEASGNSIAINLLRTFYPLLASSLQLFSENKDVTELIITVHRSLYDSIVQHDGNAAERQIIVYRRALQERVLQKRAQSASESMF
jgi:GntR family transcriptional repressor for pyruvate dehydrogenase complex